MPLPRRAPAFAPAPAGAVFVLALAVALAGVPASPVRAADPAPGASPSGEPVCADLPRPVTVAGATPADREAICRGARDAMAFFEAHRLRLPEQVRIRVTTEMPPGASPSAAGCFAEDTGTVHLLPYDRFRRFGTWFQRPIDRAMYRSLATHEVAHAMTGCNVTPARPTIQAKENVAYVAMFATMEAASRARILARYPDRGFESADRLTPLLYQFDPMAFGVESWRHHARQADGAAFIADVMVGRAMTD